jgi:diaminopropionate ammonia-lyase
MHTLRWTKNHYKTPQPTIPSFLNESERIQAWHFHASVPGYAKTPLVALENMAVHLGVQNIYVKDESPRFGLNSFKGLGCSYAMARLLASDCQLDSFIYDSLQNKIKDLPIRTFATATDGNHGRGLAWSAQLFGQKAQVFLPQGSKDYRVAKIRELGAHAEVTSVDYDSTVAMVAKLAQQHGWILVQDTAWEGYTTVPGFIMQGYLTIVHEILSDMQHRHWLPPTHVILQAGVGTFGAAIAAGLLNAFPQPMIFIVVEPTTADCFYQSALASDGLPRTNSAPLSTIMAGLSCGVPNPVAWDILKQCTDFFFTCSDDIAENGMYTLGHPLKTDPAIISGESGAVPMGLLLEACSNPSLKDTLLLTNHSRILLINSEGNTDPQNYQKVMQSKSS